MDKKYKEYHKMLEEFEKNTKKQTSNEEKKRKEEIQVIYEELYQYMKNRWNLPEWLEEEEKQIELAEEFEKEKKVSGPEKDPKK